MNQNMWFFVIAQSMTLIGAGFTIYMNINLKLKELELRLRSVEKQDDNIIRKIDNLQSSVNEIKVTLEKKMDKD